MADLIRVDLAAHQVWQGSRAVHLAPILFNILAYLVSRAGTVVTKEEILHNVWGPGWITAPNTVAVHMSRLRKAMGESAWAPTYIANVHGVGWRFEADMVARPSGSEVRHVEYLLPLRVGRHTPFQTVYDAGNRVVAAGVTPDAAAWLVRVANGALEGAGADRG